MLACNNGRNWQELSPPVANKCCEEIKVQRAPKVHVKMAFNWGSREKELGMKLANAELTGEGKGMRR